MTPIHLVILWHMHQPQYRDPVSGRYLLPWTRLHGLKDYFGMVKMLEEFPRVHATFNLVPALGQQLEEYASGKFQEVWLDAAMAPADALTDEEKTEILVRGFQLNHERMTARWPRFVELHQHVVAAGREAAQGMSIRDWRDLQLLSQLAWMDEEYLARDPVVHALSVQGANFTEADKAALRDKQIELLCRILPEYAAAAMRGQVEISTTPFYHPILPLLCDTRAAQESNPRSPQISPPFVHPEDAREQLVRARQFHVAHFGNPPAGLWPSEGSVSDAALGIAAELGFRWFASDEGVLGRTLQIDFGRDTAGVPDNAGRLYSPWRLRLPTGEIVGLFRDHYLSDLVGFVYSRMSAESAAEDLHRRIRSIGERSSSDHPLTVPLILDGENAWEYFPGNGRDFLRRFYSRIQADPDIRPLTASEAIAAAVKLPAITHIVPGSWINANFDIWAGHAEDVRAWDLLRETHEVYERSLRINPSLGAAALSPERFAHAYESLLTAEGSDWCWWYGPEHSSANDAEFDAIYRTHLSEVHRVLGAEPPEALAQPIKRPPERALVLPPSDFLRVVVDGRETSYFEWLGAGIYSADLQESAMHGRTHHLHELRYGFGPDSLFLRVDWVPGALQELRECEFHLRLRYSSTEVVVIVQVEGGRITEHSIEQAGVCLLSGKEKAQVALGNILEISLARDLFSLAGVTSIEIGVALWHGGLPVDVLPAQGTLTASLGTENFSW
ncbi:MAG TPA: glycoside hydrolase family 57 protein [Candidatus Acidoferrales bacterium]|nr:glycoside hydrolase family 57 protein [Candidatus Acidoferrales bacterium]